MNGIHDMGGMDGMGPIVQEAHEPVFHEPWERRVFAMMRGVGRWGRGRNWVGFRWAIESIPAAEYLRMSYYEKWFAMLTTRLLRAELVTPEELQRGTADPNRPRPELFPAVPNDGAARENDPSPRFRPGDPVHVRNLHPRGHTRLPRYTRGKIGTVFKQRGVFGLQDTDENGISLGGRRQEVYTVRFGAQELWGERGSARDSIYVEMWEDYLEPV